jgi:hypothetical protein
LAYPILLLLEVALAWVPLSSALAKGFGSISPTHSYFFIEQSETLHHYCLMLGWKDQPNLQLAE